MHWLVVFVVALFGLLCSAAAEYNPLLDYTLNIARSQHKSTGNVSPGVGLKGTRAKEGETTKYRALGSRKDRHDGTIEAMRKIGFDISEVYDDRKFFTATFGIDALEHVSKDLLPGLQKLQASRKLRHLLEESVPNMFGGGVVDEAHPPSSYGLDGSDVIVGIIDSGVDVTHHDFEGGRITRYFHQPAGLLGDASAVCTEACCACEEPHGTHVACIAAGRYGVAKGAEIRVVETTFYDTEILDGLNWLIQEAIQDGKPIVINLSLGSEYGSHDGQSLVSLAMTEAIQAGSADGSQAPGVSVVISAGNDYDEEWVKEHFFSAVGESVAFDITVDETVESEMAVILAVYSTYGEWVTFTVSSPTGEQYDFSFVTPDSYGCFGTAGPVPIFICAGDTNGDASAHEWLVYIGDGSFVSSSPAGTWSVTMQLQSMVEGDHKVSAYVIYVAGPSFATLVGSDGLGAINNLCTGTDILAVGSYITKYKWKSISPAGSWPDINGDGLVSYCDRGRNPVAYGDGCTPEEHDVRGKLSSFSSHGPTRDGRNKPDIAAPGAMIAAAKANTAPSYYSHLLFDADQTDAGWDLTSNYIYLHGTSMSAPHVSGGVALLLQLAPTLTANEVIELVRATARQDDITASEGVNGWGAGKMYLGAAIDLLREWAPETPSPTPKPSREPCVNDDEELVALAHSHGYHSISSCADVAPYCYHPSFMHVLSHVCPTTCLSDNNGLLHGLACYAGYCQIEQCSQVASLCSDRSIGFVLRVVCGATCGWCDAPHA